MENLFNKLGIRKNLVQRTDFLVGVVMVFIGVITQEGHNITAFGFILGGCMSLWASLSPSQSVVYLINLFLGLAVISGVIVLQGLK